jgi:hypothetical protein
MRPAASCARPPITGLDMLAAEIVAWQRATFPHGTAASAADHLLREAVELQDVPTDADEIADVFLLIVGVADRAGVNLADAVARKLAINRARTWGEPDEMNVVEHIR